MADRIPCCGVRSCRLPATYADASGVGFCLGHAPVGAATVTEDNPLAWRGDRGWTNGGEG